MVMLLRRFLLQTGALLPLSRPQRTFTQLQAVESGTEIKMMVFAWFWFSSFSTFLGLQLSNGLTDAKKPLFVKTILFQNFNTVYVLYNFSFSDEFSSQGSERDYQSSVLSHFPVLEDTTPCPWGRCKALYHYAANLYDELNLNPGKWTGKQFSSKARYIHFAQIKAIFH